MRILTVDRREANRLYERFSRFDGLPEYKGEAGRLYFLGALFDSVLIVEMAYGIVRFSDYRPPDSVRVHGLFDRREVFGAHDELKGLAERVFSQMSVESIEAIVPSERRALNRLLRDLGFCREGSVTNSVFNGTMYKRGNIYRLYKEA